MKVKDLLAKLAQADQELVVAFRSENHEYWGYLYSVAERAEVQMVDVDGPEKPSREAFVIDGF